MMNSQEAWKKQQKTIEYYKKERPEFIQRKVCVNEAKVLKEIGIWNLPENKLYGYLRLYPQDFIVEEKIDNENIIKIDKLNKDYANIESTEKFRTLYAALIKVGIPTNIAINRISKEFNIDQNKIGYAGLKDAEALTAQLITFSSSNLSVNEIKNKKISNIFLTNFYYSSGSLNPGDLDSNVFTITIRTKDKIDNSKFIAQIDLIGKYGVLNYFQSQRFGSIRLISHKLGKLIMRGEYETAVKYFLLKSNENDIPLIIELRKRAEQAYPNWEKMEKIFKEFPYSLFNELRLLNYLKSNPNNFIGALIEIKDQTQLWAYAYSSWLFNKYLSGYTKRNGCVDEKFPNVLSNDISDTGIYREYLSEDQTENFIKNLSPFKFIQLKRRLINGRMFPKNIKYKIFNGGVVINFTLPKGSYATTMLTNLFELYQGMPIPEWVNLDEIDPKEMLEQGSIKEIKEIFEDYWHSKLD